MFKRQTVTGPYSHVYSQDPAIDRGNPSFDHEQYTRTGDAKFLPLIRDLQPVTFELRHLAGRERAALGGVFSRYPESDSALMFFDIVELALVGISNGTTSDGAEVLMSTDYDKVRKVKVASRSVLDDIFSIDNGKLLMELGNRVIKETFGDPT